MGLEKNTKTNNALYLFQGKIITNATKESHDLVKNGKFYNEFNSVSGTVMEVKVVDGYEGSKDLCLTISDEGTDYKLYFGINSSYFKTFARSIKNVDFSSKIEFYPTYKVENDIKKTALLMKQNNEWIKRFYTVENMGEMPTAQPIELNGKVTYDYSKQNDFLIAELMAKFEKEKLPF